MLATTCLSLRIIPPYRSISPVDSAMHTRSWSIHSSLHASRGLTWMHLSHFNPNSLPAFQRDAFDLAVSHGVHPVGIHIPSTSRSSFFGLRTPTVRGSPVRYFFSIVPPSSELGGRMRLREDVGHKTAVVLWRQAEGEKADLVHVDVLKDEGFEWRDHLYDLGAVLRRT
ncbi:hypothetical protein PHSY_001995 [Pseudozyma hubeiensis SY62]|uniref:Uncharacterized protein n=1 Tax=Pseudozyma hubeiensis (strain SY62) TaxID=1305764 RepID=R9P031_PSEHS|nr:hypothetical protein PHSY_001995 [Pseudozyma hubeiensis SY62]GAC94424.1 hypothetical protein PHSY_001995 [Pseudozyma hubeiensis SY62]